MSVAAWDKFFCFSCTRDHPLTLKVKFRNKVICAYCHNRVLKNDAAARYREHNAPGYTPTEREPIPQSILDAYAEAHEAAD